MSNKETKADSFIVSFVIIFITIASILIILSSYGDFSKHSIGSEVINTRETYNFGDVNVSGNTYFGQNNSTLYLYSNIGTDIVPVENNNIGSPDKRWTTIYANNIIGLSVTAGASTITTNNTINISPPSGTGNVIIGVSNFLNNVTEIGSIITGVWESNIIGTSYGGTGLSIIGQNNILVGGSNNNIDLLSPNGNDKYLKLVNNIPSWEDLGNIQTQISSVQSGNTGLSISPTAGEVKIYFNTHKGLSIGTNGVDVLLGNGLEFDTNGGISVLLGNGLEFDTNGGISLSAIDFPVDNITEGNGITVSEFNDDFTIGVSFVPDRGLSFDNGSLVVSTSKGIENTSAGLSVKLGNGLEFDTNGGISLSAIDFLVNSIDPLNEGVNITNPFSDGNYFISLNLPNVTPFNINNNDQLDFNIGNGLSIINNGLSAYLDKGLKFYGTSIGIKNNLTDITTVGTITEGSWNASIIDTSFGGTGVSIFSQGDLLVGNNQGGIIKLNKSLDGKVLTVGGSSLIWSDLISGTQVDEVQADNTGLSISPTTGNVKIYFNTDKGLSIGTNGVDVLLGNGLEFDTNGGVSVLLGNGLEFDTNGGVSLSAINFPVDNITQGNGITVSEFNDDFMVGVSFAPDRGLSFDNGSLVVSTSKGIENTSTGLSVILGNGLEFDTNGGISLRAIDFPEISIDSLNEGVSITNPNNDGNYFISLNLPNVTPFNINNNDQLDFNIGNGLSIINNGLSAYLGRGLLFNTQGGISLDFDNAPLNKDQISALSPVKVTKMVFNRSTLVYFSLDYETDNFEKVGGFYLKPKITNGLGLYSGSLGIKLSTGMSFDSNGNIITYIDSPVKDIIEGDGITVSEKNNDFTIGVSLAPDRGLSFDNGSLEVLTSKGIQNTSTGLSVILGNGLEFDTNDGISLRAIDFPISSISGDQSIILDNNNGAYSLGLSLAPNKGLSISTDGLTLQTGNGLSIINNGLSAYLGNGLLFNTQGGISLDFSKIITRNEISGSDPINIRIGENIDFDNFEAIGYLGEINLDTDNSYFLEPIDNNSKLGLKINKGLIFDSNGGLSVKLSTGLEFDSNGGISLSAIDFPVKNITQRDGITVSEFNDDFTVGVSFAPDRGLSFDNGSLVVPTSKGIENTSTGLSVILGNGLEFDTNDGISLRAIDFPVKTIASDLNTIFVADNNGVENEKTVSLFIDQDDPNFNITNGKLGLKIHRGLSFDSNGGVSVNLSTGLEFDTNGSISLSAIDFPVDNITPGNGITVSEFNDDFTVGVSFAPDRGLCFDNGSLVVSTSKGIENTSAGLSVKLGNGLEFDTNDGIDVNVSNQGIKIDNNSIGLSLGNGLDIISQGLSVKLSTGLEFDNNGGVSLSAIDFPVSDINASNGIAVTGNNVYNIGLSISSGLDLENQQLIIKSSSGTKFDNGLGLSIGSRLQIVNNKLEPVITTIQQTINPVNNSLKINEPGFNSFNIGVSLSPDKGLSVYNNGVGLKISNGLNFGSEGLSVSLGTGLAFNGNDIVTSGIVQEITEDPGIKIQDNGNDSFSIGTSLGVNPGLSIINNGLVINPDEGLELFDDKINCVSGYGVFNDDKINTLSGQNTTYGKTPLWLYAGRNLGTFNGITKAGLIYSRDGISWQQAGLSIPNTYYDFLADIAFGKDDNNNNIWVIGGRLDGDSDGGAYVTTNDYRSILYSYNGINDWQQSSGTSLYSCRNILYSSDKNFWLSTGTDVSNNKEIVMKSVDGKSWNTVYSIDRISTNNYNSLDFTRLKEGKDESNNTIFILSSSLSRPNTNTNNIILVKYSYDGENFYDTNFGTNDFQDYVIIAEGNIKKFNVLDIEYGLDNNNKNIWFLSTHITNPDRNFFTPRDCKYTFYSYNGREWNSNENFNKEFTFEYGTGIDSSIYIINFSKDDKNNNSWFMRSRGKSDRESSVGIINIYLSEDTKINKKDILTFANWTFLIQNNCQNYTNFDGIGSGKDIEGRNILLLTDSIINNTTGLIQYSYDGGINWNDCTGYRFNGLANSSFVYGYTSDIEELDILDLDYEKPLENNIISHQPITVRSDISDKNAIKVKSSGGLDIKAERKIKLNNKTILNLYETTTNSSITKQIQLEDYASITSGYIVKFKGSKTNNSNNAYYDLSLGVQNILGAVSDIGTLNKSIYGTSNGSDITIGSSSGTSTIDIVISPDSGNLETIWDGKFEIISKYNTSF